MNIEAKILEFPDLSPDEQAEVEAYVADHPSWESLLRDVKRLNAWAEDARLLRDPHHKEAIALYAVAQRMHPDYISSELQPVFEEIERLLDTDAEVRRLYDEATRRLDDLEAAFDPVSHFESLTGHSLSDVDLDDAADADDEADSENLGLSSEGLPPSANDTLPRNSSADTSTSSVREPSSRPRKDRDPERSSTPIYSLRRASRWAVAALVVFTVGYGVLFGVSRAAEPPLLAMAEMQVDEDVLDTYPLRTRGESSTTTTDALYLEALRHLRDARQSTLGLFPSFDETALREAETRLVQVADRTDPNSFLWGEALFYLGKINLAQEDVQTARQALKQVAQSDGRRAEEAYELLVQLQDVAPVDDPAS